MDNAISEFFGWHTLVFGLACYILTFFTRRIVETEWPILRKKADENSPNMTYATTFSRWWNQVLLYIIPVFWGCLTAALAKQYPFPVGMQTLSGRLFFGVVIGFFSSFLYKIVRRTLAAKLGIADTSSISPPPS